MKTLAQQIQCELDSAAWYLSLSFWAEVSGFQCLSTWCRAASAKEKGEAQHIATFVIGRLGEAIPAAESAMVSVEFGSLLEATEAMLERELAEIEELEKLCNDPCVNAWMYPLLTKSIQEISSLREKVATIRAGEDDSTMDYLFWTDLSPGQ